MIIKIQKYPVWGTRILLLCAKLIIVFYKIAENDFLGGFMKKTWKFSFLLLLAGLCVSQCVLPATPGSFTGAGIENATVSIGDQSTMTGPAGSFSISYASAGSITGNVFVYKGLSYSFWAVYNVEINNSSNPQYTFYLTPWDYSGSTHFTISGTLPATAVASGYIRLIIKNNAGGMYANQRDFIGGENGYSLETYTTGSDCLIEVDCCVDPGSPSSRIIQYYSHQNLSANLTLNITPLAKSTITVTGTTGDIFMGDLDLIPVDIPNYVQSMLVVSSQSISVYNGDNYPILWKTAAITPNTPVANYQTLRFNVGNSTPFSSAVTLPTTAVTVTAPSGVVSGAAWDNSSRCLSFTGGAGATMHICQFVDNSWHQGYILSNSTSITIPAGLYTDVLGPGSGWDIKLIPACSNQSISNFIEMRLSVYGPTDITNTQLSFILAANTPASDNWVDLIP
jgi:hypothetical protein